MRKEKSKRSGTALVAACATRQGDHLPRTCGVKKMQVGVRTACCFGALSKVFLSVLLLPGQSWCNATSVWYEVVRGPRPQSVQWPRRQQWYPSNQWSGQWPAVSDSWRTPIRRRWHRNNVPRLNPYEAKAAARTRVDRLETALAALGETESAEARGLHVPFEGGPTCCTRTSIGGSSGGVSGVHQEVTGQVCSIGTGTGEKTERVGRRIGPHGEIPRRDDPGRSVGAARVSHDSPRAQTCTLESPDRPKHHQNSTRRPP